MAPFPYQPVLKFPVPKMALETKIMVFAPRRSVYVNSHEMTLVLSASTGQRSSTG